MKSPITSPSSAVLTSSATITSIPSISAATSRAASAPEISLWSVIAIAPRPRSRAVSSRTSTGVAQSGEWSVCMCRSQWIVRARREPASNRRLAGGVVAPRGDPRVDLLELVGDLAPAPPSAAEAAAQPPAQARLGDQPPELAGERDRVAGREQQPALAVAGQLLVDRRDARPRARLPAAIAARSSPGAGLRASGGDAERRRRRRAAASGEPSRRAAPCGRARAAAC